MSRKAPTRLPVGTMLQCEVRAMAAAMITAPATIAAGTFMPQYRGLRVPTAPVFGFTLPVAP